MNAQKIQERIAQLSLQLESLIRDVNATVGALNDAKYWLGEVEKEEAEAKKTGTVEPIMSLVEK